ncbi:glycosyltransferase [Gramella sp. BOM4]|nr:glycosyltransferase [Christiangramia bathymodioli]
MIDFHEFKKRYEKAEVEHYPTSVSKKPMVSVLVQTYNHEKFIEQCLESILSQKTNFNFEIILGEDESSDNTRSICLEYAKKFPESIRLLLHRKKNKIRVNGITTGNFNAIYNLFTSKGKYIAFCEGDDFWTDPFKLQKQVDFLGQNDNFSFCYHKFTEKSTSDNKDFILLDQPDIDLCMENLINLKYHPQLSTVCFRNIFSQLPEEILNVINVDSFILSLLGNYGPAKFLGDISPSIYHRHSGGIWTKNEQILKLQLKAITFKNLQKYYRNEQKIGAARAFGIYLRNINRSLFVLYLKKKNIISAMKLTPGIF